MATYLGRDWDREKLSALVGDMRQIAGAYPYVYTDGKADGVRGVRFDTGGGLQFTVLPGRGMDIPEAVYKGKPVSFVSGTGITAPGYYEEPGLRWLRSFFAGLLTTCGIVNSGAPTVDGGVPFGLHGRVSNAGAENVCLEQEWKNGDYVMRLKGTMRESQALFENLALTRSIETTLGSSGFILHDVVENRGFEPEPLLMLYHINFGFPLLGPRARVIAPVVKTEPRDEEARKDRGVEECMTYPEPVPGYQEKVFFHTLAADKDGNTFAALFNPEAGDSAPLGCAIRFNMNELPMLTQWKMPRKGFYVTGLEPGTVTPLGRGALRESGGLCMIEGRQRYSITIRFEFIDSAEQGRALEQEAHALTSK